jgi:hypothetical protein
VVTALNMSWKDAIPAFAAVRARPTVSMLTMLASATMITSAYAT